MGEGPARAETRGMSERVLTEVIKTPALKELMILLMKDIDPDTAPGLVRTALWGEAALSLSMFGAFPQMANWLVEFLLEAGRQMNHLPEPLLKELLVKVGSGIDSSRLRRLPVVYGELAARLLVGGGADAADACAAAARAANRALAGLDRMTGGLEADRERLGVAVAAGLDELDTVALGRVLNRLVALGNSVRRARRHGAAERMRSLLSQVDPGELFSMLAGAAGSFASAARVLLGQAAALMKGRRRAGPGR